MLTWPSGEGNGPQIQRVPWVQHKILDQRGFKPSTSGMPGKCPTIRPRLPLCIKMQRMRLWILRDFESRVYTLYVNFYGFLCSFRFLYTFTFFFQLTITVTTVHMEQERYAAVIPENTTPRYFLLDINSNAERVDIPVTYTLITEYAGK